jgi:probable rRNA maturation factor
VRGLASKLKRAVAIALSEGGAEADADLTLVLSTDRHVQSLNRAFRDKDTPTNVLSFPSDEIDYLGDVAIAYGVAAREAKAAGKSLADHAVHLAVHGVLHLAGFDHVTERQARRMEPKEVRILAQLDIADPYRGTA